MKSVTRTLPGTLDAYISMVDDALFEVSDMLADIEHEDGQGPICDVVTVLQAHLQQLLDELKAGTHKFEDEDLPYMTLLARQIQFMLPCKPLLEDINATHRQGLEP